jgi:hypothetical protein
VIIRLLLWNLSDSKTTLAELRTRLRYDQNRIWISDELTERFGVIETWDDAAGNFPEVIRELIGKDPEIAEEFDVEDVEA